MELLIAFIWKLVAFFGGAKAIEKMLEDFLMNQAWMPQVLKKYVVPVGALVTAIILAVNGGVPLGEAIAQAILGAGTIMGIHDHPALTSADWGAPAATADGLPELP